MTCPKCNSSNVEEEDHGEEEFYSFSYMHCLKCGCRWSEEWILKVDEPGEKDEE